MLCPCTRGAGVAGHGEALDPEQLVPLLATLGTDSVFFPTCISGEAADRPALHIRRPRTSG
jgi:hypothetical protein